ncbi:MAG: PQQ-binding-like beta-propeller repeat protein [bacterium]|nr:PQQ-binding-like beta-propeller repeat protein [bacterium]
MNIIFAFLFVFYPTYTYKDWTKYGATLENTHIQTMRGAMFSAPDVKWSYKTGFIVESYGATVTDIDKDDTMEVVVGSSDNKIYCFNGVTGGLKWNYATSGTIYSSPAIADVDNDDTLDIVVANNNDKTYCLNGITGKEKWNYITSLGFFSSPTIADIDKDDTMEVVIGSRDNKVYCFNGATGAAKWKYTTGDWIHSSPAIADVNNDDTLDVLIGSDDHKIYCLNGATGKMQWSYLTGGMVYSSPAIADIDKDDTMEVVLGSEDNKVYCFNGMTGRVKWSYATGGWIYSSPAIADVNNDDTLDVLIGSNDNKVYCFNGVTGGVEWSHITTGDVHRGISVADIDMDNKLEILSSNYDTDYLFCLNGEDGSFLWDKRFDIDVHDITIADIDNDGCVELVVGVASDYTVYALDDISNSVNCGCMRVEEKSNLKNQNPKLSISQNPFFQSTVVKYQIPATSKVSLALYDISGSCVKTLINEEKGAGNYDVTVNTKGLSSGIYFAKLSAGNYSTTKKLILMK